MDKNCISTLLISSTLLICSNAFAAKINVPDDFPNSFHMDLLSGSVFVDMADGGAGPGEIEVFPTGTDGISQILFDATEFEGDASSAGEGTSNLTLTSNQMNVASFIFNGITGNFYLDGSGTGTLFDNGNGSGEWTMELPLYAEFSGQIFNFSDITLTTNASHTYNGFNDITGLPTTHTIDGISMDYETGDAFLVGQSTITDPDHPWFGLRITLGLEGNDPVMVSAVPVPAAVWLMGSGLIALFSISRRKIS